MSNIHTLLPRRPVYPWRTTAILDDGTRITEVLPATDNQQAEERLYRLLPAGAQVVRLAAVRLAHDAAIDLPDTIPMSLAPPAAQDRPRRLQALPRQPPAAVSTPTRLQRVLLVAMVVVAAAVTRWAES